MSVDEQKSAGAHSSWSTGVPQTDDAQEITSLSTGPRIPMPTMTDCNIEAFFYSLEFWFMASGITKDTRKFVTVCATLPPNKLMELKPVIDAAPANKKYEYIKQELIEHLADSEKKRVQKVLSDMPLGDRNPSDLYKEMKRVAGTSLSDTVILDLWISRLPKHVQPAIIATSVQISEKLKIADSIVETLTWPQGNISEIQRNEEISVLRNEISQISRDMRKLINEKKTTDDVLAHVVADHRDQLTTNAGITRNSVIKQQNAVVHVTSKQQTQQQVHNDTLRLTQFLAYMKMLATYAVNAYAYTTHLLICNF